MWDISHFFNCSFLTNSPSIGEMTLGSPLNITLILHLVASQLIVGASFWFPLLLEVLNPHIFCRHCDSIGFASTCPFCEFFKLPCNFLTLLFASLLSCLATFWHLSCLLFSCLKSPPHVPQASYSSQIALSALIPCWKFTLHARPRSHHLF